MEKPYGLNIFSIAEIQIIVAAYAYEKLDTPCMGDSTFDILARSIEPSMVKKMDYYTSFTGQWINTFTKSKKIDLSILGFTKKCIIEMENNADDFMHHTYIENVLGVK
jgi:hypothetical protein